ncbi:MAG: CoA transferase, partial [Acidimicrobiia bacterium]|nr:CoA transferase [Acidimicrobiia bacterium]
MSSPLLAGWTVLDLTDHRGDVGPYVLAELGADVLKVEPPGGCPTRRSGPAAHHFAAYNSNKRLVGLSGDPAGDRAAVLALAAGVDVVFDSGPPGRLAALDIGDDDLAAVNPTVVRVLVTPFGADGPRADQPASELTVAALGGPMRL